MSPETGSSVPEDPLAPVPDDLLGGGDDSRPGSERAPDDAQARPETTPADAAVSDAQPGSDTNDERASDRTEDASEVPGDVEGLIADLERTSHERDDFLESFRRTQAEFENYRKRVMKQQAEDVARAAESLVEKLLPVLDACDGAVRHGAVEVEPVFAALLGALEKEGLGRIDPVGEPFDPNVHEAVMHEPAVDEDENTVVSDVMRPGYSWKGRIIRPAMVKVRG